MDMNHYQNEAMRTAIYPVDQGIEYTTLGLVGEAGEVANKVKKVLRDNNGYFSPESKKAVAEELSDCMWYCAALARELGYPLNTLAVQNLEKLESRRQRGKLQGSGDSR